MARCAVLAAALLWLSVAPRFTAGAGELMASPLAGQQECQRKCGDVEIPFPFGYGPDHCMLHPNFRIQCSNTAGNGVFKPFLANSGVEVVDISLSAGQVRVLNNVSSYCYDAESHIMDEPNIWNWNLGTTYMFSDAANKFTVVGCRVVAYIGDDRGNAASKTYKTGCVATCQPDDLNSLNNSVSCSGMGCCQTAIPKGLHYYQVWFEQDLSTLDESLSTSVGPCSYAVLMESSNFTFEASYLTPSSDLRKRMVPVVLDWVVSDDRDGTTPGGGSACVSKNSRCISVASRRGYICECTEGFEGNPYIPDGCTDVDECKDTTYDYDICFGECHNTIGNFTCSCPAGTRGDAYTENGCQKDFFPPRARIAVGIFAGLLVALVAFLATEVFRKKQSNKRQGYFEQHGGKVLLDILKSQGIQFTFFDRREIVKATSNFRKTNIVGEGAHGAVYKAIFDVGDTTTTAAVKRCKRIDKSRTDEFVRELVVLCGASHPNIVKLLGCCLHFEAPILVYEFVQNGTSNDLLHGKPKRCVTLATRLRIAAEAAEALAYLHSPPHRTLHGDVKPENILLGEGWVAKVSDFGCSTINDNVQVVPKGTLTYLDPEFLEDMKITEKTDVHSFGVVLMELLTGKKPLTNEKNMRIIFQESLRNGTLGELLDGDIVMEGAMVVISQAAELASRCTAVPGNTRPAMGQVAEELRRLSNEMPEHYQALQALEGSGYSYAAAESGTTGFYTVGGVAALSTELAR